MQYTISFHQGGEKDYVREHNNRTRDLGDWEAHIDREREHEIWKDQDPKDAYKELFSEAIKERNQRIIHSKTLSKAEKSKRIIRNYYRDVLGDKQKNTVYESIISIGSRDERPESHICKDILKSYTDGWSERNPNMKLIGAYYHDDEMGASHLHLDYVPIGHYEKGQSVRNSQGRALEEMGYKLKTVAEHGEYAMPITQWQRDEREHLATLMKERGLGVKKLKSKTAHKTVAEFKAMKIDDTLNKVTTQGGDVVKKLKEFKEGDTIMANNKGEASVIRDTADLILSIQKNKSAFNQFLVERAIEKENAVNKIVSDKIQKKIGELKDFEKEVKELESNVDEKSLALDKKVDAIAEFAKEEVRDAYKEHRSEMKRDLEKLSEVSALGLAVQRAMDEGRLPIDLELALREDAKKNGLDVEVILDRYAEVEEKVAPRSNERVEQHIREDKNEQDIEL